MLKKMILPVLAVIIALSSALAAPILSQTGWYKNASGVGVLGTITTPPGNTPVCIVQVTGTQCMISIDGDNFPASDTKAHAEAGTGLLRYK